ncbi:MAG: Bifunctional protein FolD protein [Thaumarchaeota archaeon]|nr:Bifunctional protein FolD protein [Nitrososphaerota archaeon]
MAGQKIDGIEVSNAVKDILKSAVEKLNLEDVIPCLATVLVGDDPASATYVKNKHNACEKVGIKTMDHKLSTDTTQKELDKIIDNLNNDKEVHGILVQLPLPKQLNEFATISRISPIKDVDGLTPQNVGLLSMGKSILKPCTPSGIMEMFYYYKINLQGKNVVMINRSNLIGKPLYHLLLQNNATVVTCHSKTENLHEYCKNADVIITAVGDRAKFKLTSDMIKQDAIVIDVAISRHEGKLVGDADYDDIIQKASWVTPVPGGVGPMTVAMLLKNTVTAASLSKEIVG